MLEYYKNLFDVKKVPYTYSNIGFERVEVIFKYAVRHAVQFREFFACCGFHVPGLHTFFILVRFQRGCELTNMRHSEKM